MEQDFDFLDVIEGEDLPGEDTAPAEGEDLPGEDAAPTEGEDLPGEDAAPAEGEISISGNDLEVILETISGNDLGEDLSALKDQLLQSDEIRASESEAVVEACRELNQTVEYSTLSLSILLGVLIGILLVQPFAAFLKGV